MSHSAKCIDTLIGAGMRVEGDIACTGVLHVQGDILGNVSCQENATAKLVVDSAGSVNGTVNATHVAVRGRVIGPVESSQTIEIHQGGSLVGDVSFREIAIHAGGVVEGLLNPIVALDCNAVVRECRPQASAGPAAVSSATPLANGSGFVEGLGGARKIGVVMLAAIGVVTVAWMGRQLAVIDHPAEDVALRSESSLQDSAGPIAAPAGGGELRNDPRAVDSDAAPLARDSSVDAEDAVPTSSPNSSGVNRGNVVTVRGANPRRSAGVFLLISNEPSILYKKKRDDPAEGARISLAEGEKASVAIAPDELIRVAQGRDVVILFQGQKVSRTAIESGSWISFVPR